LQKTQKNCLLPEPLNSALYVKMKSTSELNKAIFFITIGLVIGGVISLLVIDERIESLMNDAKEGEWLEADKFLRISKSIRNKKYKEALLFSESMLNLNLINITNNGEKISNFTKNELYILKEVNYYKEQECSLECLKRLDGKYK